MACLDEVELRLIATLRVGREFTLEIQNLVDAALLKKEKLSKCVWAKEEEVGTKNLPKDRADVFE